MVKVAEETFVFEKLEQELFFSLFAFLGNFRSGKSASSFPLPKWEKKRAGADFQREEEKNLGRNGVISRHAPRNFQHFHRFSPPFHTVYVPFLQF